MSPDRDVERQARLLCAFANTLDIDVDADPPEAWPDTTALGRWLKDADLLATSMAVSEPELELAKMLRAGIRGAMLSHNSDERGEWMAALDEAAAHLSLKVSFDGSRPELTPGDGGIRGALEQVLIAIANCETAGQWSRLKVCVAPECRLAFIDASKNQSRQWCSMGQCGNRAKTRRYRAKRR